MRKAKNYWKEMRPYEKRCEVAFWVCLGLALLTLAFDILSMLGVLKSPFDAYFIPTALMAVGSACATVSSWRLDHSWAVTYRRSAIWFGICTVWGIVKLLIL